MEDYSRYNGEGTMLRKAQMREVEILVEVDKICRKHNIKYWINYGTLLGAVRHKGFIPWDDDLDISMLSDDYKKFLEVAPKELPEWLFLQNKTTDPSYIRSICKVRDLNSFFVEQYDDFSAPYKKGIFIDIFEMIEYPKLSKKTLRFLTKWLCKTDQFFKIRQYITFKNIVAGITFPFIKLFLTIFWKCAYIRKSNDIACWPTLNTSGSRIDKNHIFPLSEIEFEGMNFMAPNNPDACLKSFYKDYMKIPKEEDRWIHSKYIFVEERQS